MVLLSYAIDPPSRARMIGRGLRGRCGLCGSAGLFRHWLVMVESCPRCGLRFERIDGHWIGAIGINTVVSFAVLLIIIAVGTALTVPDVPLVPLLVAAVGTSLVFPIAFQPISRTLWTAIDLSVRPIEPDELT